MGEKDLYPSYNGLSRNPAPWGIPYMTGLFLMSFTLLTTVALLIYTDGTLFLIPLVIGITLLLFVKNICENDNRAVEVFLLELKWTFIKIFYGNSKRHGGTLTISPITYGRVTYKNAKRYFKKSVSR